MAEYVRLDLTRSEAKALLTLGRSLMDDEESTERVFSNDIDVSAAFRGLGKITEGLLGREKKPKKK